MVDISNLKFQLSGNGNSFTVNVSLDERGKITNVFSSDPDAEKILVKGGNRARLQDHVDAVVNGVISTDQLEVKNYGHSQWYKIDHLQ